ncbi:MAG: hypothetical protein ACHP65_07600 [Legionellales bacterium]
MKNKKHKQTDDWNYLAPYPKPGKNEDRLVSRVETFTNVLLKTMGAIAFVFNILIKPFSFISQLFEKRTWEKRELAVPADELVQPEEPGVAVANKTQAMDQNFFYSLKQGRIWYKPIAASKQSPWKLFGPDGLPPGGNKLTSISSDGVNVIGIDESRTVHYVHTDAINFVLTKNNWKIKNISLDWTDHWFSMPIAGSIVGLMRGHELKVPENCHAVAISQKGPETGYYTDMSGKKQPEFFVGVTTLYVLSTNGRIYFADPWLGNEFRNEITAPEDGQFVAENMAASASTVFLLRRDKTGKPVMYTRFADFDSLGSNPLLPATYDADNHTPLVRRLPAEDWIQQPEIILKDQARVTSKIAILQTGRGQNNRQLRVEGANAEGEPGFFLKGIYEKDWHFEVVKGLVLEENKQAVLEKAPPPPVDFNAKQFTFNQEVPIKTIQIKKFLRHGLNERGLHTIVELELSNGRKLELPLYAQRRLTHLLGFNNNLPYWQLVMPKEYQQEKDPEVRAVLKALFKNNTDISVNVNELENGDIQMSNSNGISIEFNPIKPNIVQLLSKHQTISSGEAPQLEAYPKIANSKKADTKLKTKPQKDNKAMSATNAKASVLNGVAPTENNAALLTKASLKKEKPTTQDEIDMTRAPKLR